MAIAFLIGRIILGIFYLFNASNHFMNLDMMGGYAGSKGVPAPKLSVIVSGIMLLLGGLSIILGFMPYVGVILLVAFLVPTAFLMHNFWAIEDQGQRQSEMVQFTKDLALAASALMFLAIPTPWPISL